MSEIVEYVTDEMKDLLKQIADLAYKASEEVYDDDKEDGSGGILLACDALYGKIDAYLGKDESKDECDNERC